MVVPCAVIASAFVVPWYVADYDYFQGADYRIEYSVGLDRLSVVGYPNDSHGIQGTETQIGNLIMIVSIVLALSLVSSAVAVVSEYRGRKMYGVVASGYSVGFLLVAVVIFYFGIMQTLRIDSFTSPQGITRSLIIHPGPMLGWWVVLAATTVQAAQTVVLAYSEYRDLKRPLGR